ncbi:MAG: hypothetical protein ACLVAU_13295 [Ruminococcus sp.]
MIIITAIIAIGNAQKCYINGVVSLNLSILYSPLSHVVLVTKTLCKVLTVLD